MEVKIQTVSHLQEGEGMEQSMGQFQAINGRPMSCLMGECARGQGYTVAPGVALLTSSWTSTFK